MPCKQAKDFRAIEKEMRWGDRDICHTISDSLSKISARHPAHPAFSWFPSAHMHGGLQTLNWGAFCAQSFQAANLFYALGIRQGDVVALLLPDSIEAVTAFVGGTIAGIAMPINPTFSAKIIGQLLKQSEAKILVTLKEDVGPDFHIKKKDAFLENTEIEIILEVDVRCHTDHQTVWDIPKSWVASLVREKKSARFTHTVLDFITERAKQPTGLGFEPQENNRVCAYFHTSGTTGYPKIVRHKMSAMLYNGWLGARLFFSEYGAVMCFLPLSQIGCAQFIVQSALFTGMHVILCNGLSQKSLQTCPNVGEYIKKSAVNFIIAPPALITKFATSPNIVQNANQIKAVFSTGSALCAELAYQFEKKTGVKLIEIYGLAEATSIVSSSPLSNTRKIGSVGLAVPYTDIKIYKISANHSFPHMADTGEIGEIYVSSPGVYVDYTYKEKSKNKDLFVEGCYVRTGDLGFKDREDFLFITGFAQDLIVQKGQIIDPMMIEKALILHANVASVSVVAQPDAQLGEIACAYVQCVKTVSDKKFINELKAFAAKHVRAKVARSFHIEIIADFPETVTGCVSKFTLRKMAIARVYNKALRDGNAGVEVSHIEEHSGQGVIVYLRPIKTLINESDVKYILNDYHFPWQWG